MLDFPLPLRPVMALKRGSNPIISVLCAYDLKPSMTIDLMNIVGKYDHHQNNNNLLKYGAQRYACAVNRLLIYRTNNIRKG